MTYSANQIKFAKRAYNNFLQIETPEQQNTESKIEAENRADFHNNIVNSILDGNKKLENEWKLFFLNEEVKADQKADASKVKKAANKAASADILSPIKKIRKLGAFGKWLNVAGNEYRKQHFNKKYTADAVDAFLKTL